MKYSVLRLLVFAFLLSFSAFSTARAATAGYDFQVRYDIYAGGMHLIDITQQIHMTATRYSSTLIAKPTGYFSKIVPWEGHYATNGVVQKGVLVPQYHAKTSRWGNERDETIMHFDKHGQLTRMTDVEWIISKAKPAAKDVTPDPSLSHDAVDLVTSILRLLLTAQDKGLTQPGACNASQIVFDGKRRFTMAFKDLGTDKLVASNYNAFHGTARHCEIEIKPLGGFKGKKRGFYKIQEASRALGELPSLWLMPAWNSADAPPVPVRMKIKSDYGAIMVHATKITR